MIEIFIPGHIPSQKNMHRIAHRNGKAFIMKDPKIQQWRKENKKHLENIKGISGPVSMDIRIVRENRRKADLDNMWATLNDFLKEYGTIEDDDCFNIVDAHIWFDGVDKEKAGAYIRVSPVLVKPETWETPLLVAEKS